MFKRGIYRKPVFQIANDIRVRFVYFVWPSFSVSRRDKRARENCNVKGFFVLCMYVLGESRLLFVYICAEYFLSFFSISNTYAIIKRQIESVNRLRAIVVRQCRITVKPLRKLLPRVLPQKKETRTAAILTYGARKRCTVVAVTTYKQSRGKCNA